MFVHGQVRAKIANKNIKQRDLSSFITIAIYYLWFSEYCSLLISLNGQIATNIGKKCEDIFNFLVHI